MDLVYFKFKENRLLCGRHWNDMYKPRCFGCDESIFTDSFTVAEGKNWHLNHFACFRCDKPIADAEYIVVNGQPQCLKCHDARVGGGARSSSGGVRFSNVCILLAGRRASRAPGAKR